MYRIKEYYHKEIGQTVYVVQTKVKFLFWEWWSDGFGIHGSLSSARQELDGMLLCQKRREQDKVKATKYYDEEGAEL